MTGGGTSGIDYEMDRVEAQKTQNEAIRADVLLIWVISWGTGDFGDKFIARPHIVGARYMHRHLKADTLDGLRALLPAGLTRMEPDPADDPVIVEVWL